MVTQNDTLVPDVTTVGSRTRSCMYQQPQWELKPLCDCCSVTKAVVYCKSDSARLCLPCDDYVHSANSLARSHLRSLICDKCNSGSAVTRCVDDKLSLCEGCDGTCSAHSRRQMLRCYTGCPTIDEFSKIWAFEQPASSDSVDWGVLNLKAASSSSPNLNENDMSSAVLQNINGGTDIEDELDRLVMNTNISKSDGITELHPAPTDLHHYDPSFVTLVSPPTLNCLSKVLPGSSENLGVVQNYNLFQQLDVENLSHLNNEIKTPFSTDHQGKYQFEIDEGDMENLLLGQKKTDGSSTKHVEVPSYSDGVVTFPPSFIPTASSSSSSSVIGMPSVMNPSPNWSCNKMVNNLEFPESNMFLPLPNIIGASETTTVASDQDCSSWSKLLSVEEPWESNLEASSPQARDKAKMRYNEKKKSRKFEKQIRYASRKARADTRKRVKGRFVKAGEAYDYDPAPSTN